MARYNVKIQKIMLATIHDARIVLSLRSPIYYVKDLKHISG